ncbi:unnamed protein product [Pelagomonas calceolata]|uniref:Uncharacterized protein n=1 Tax=Pelagomonas calceolata TaxID=35677 RepID=A0A8J2S7T3_9STRA|nr:unnamed protein product [Pelagomonas calceolata]|mmetsp:Transcript_16568/g.51767  ORF Transcript_16568/g.51767 Transcript_16568/m.51767 type:complete len:358 (+) Transcript_16568:108-1181(+)
MLFVAAKVESIAILLCLGAARAACDPSSWPDLDTHVCGGCKALVNWKPYGSTCGGYCSGIGLTCVDGWEEVGDDGCTEGENLGCDRSYFGTGDAICECAGDYDEANYGACRQSNCPCQRGFRLPGDWGWDATADINYVRTNAFIAAAVNCACTRCGHYDFIKAWPAYDGGCGIAQTVVADGSAASQVVLNYYPLDDSTCAATQTKVQAFPDGVCLDPQTTALPFVKFTCSADGATYDYEAYGADPNCQGAADAGSAFAIPTPGCGLSADPSAPGESYISAECFGPDYNSDMSCGAPANTVDAGKKQSSGQTTSSRRSRALVAVVVAVAAFAGACCAAAVTVLRLRKSSEATVTPARP